MSDRGQFTSMGDRALSLRTSPARGKLLIPSPEFAKPEMLKKWYSLLLQRSLDGVATRAGSNEQNAFWDAVFRSREAVPVVRGT